MDAEALGVGHGRLDLGLGADFLASQPSVGGFLDYSHRISESVSAFARAEAGWLPHTHEAYGAARAGVRVRF